MISTASNFVRREPLERLAGRRPATLCFNGANNESDITTVIRDFRGRAYFRVHGKIHMARLEALSSTSPDTTSAARPSSRA